MNKKDKKDKKDLLIESHQINIHHKYYKEAMHLCFLSKNFYNATLYAVRQQYFKDGTYLSYYDVNKEFTHTNQKDYRALPAKVSKMTQQLVESEFKSFFALLKMKKKGTYDKPIHIPRYLNKIKGKQVVQYPKQSLSFKKKGYIRLSGTDIYIKSNISEEKVQAARIVPFGNYVKIEIIYKGEKVIEKDKKDKYAAIDIGINNLMTITSNQFNPIIVNGKPVKSINAYYNKKVAKEKSKLWKVNKRETSKYIKFLGKKRTNKINDYLHKATTYLVNQLVSNNVDTLIIGYNQEWKQDTDMGTKNNQNFVYIPFLRMIEMLEYKCYYQGIRVIIHEESYTSKCSYLDNEELCHHDKYLGRRKYRGLFITNKGIRINADVNGSLNIMRKVIGKKVAVNGANAPDIVKVCSMPSIVNF